MTFRFTETNNEPVKLRFDTDHTHIIHEIFQHAAPWGGSDSSASKFKILKWYMVPDLKNMHLLLKYEGWNFNSGNYLFTTDTK